MHKPASKLYLFCGKKISSKDALRIGKEGSLMAEKPYVVAIAGGTCSGKSTLAQRLLETFGESRTLVLNMDSYFKKEPPTTIAPITRKEYVEHNSPDTLELDRLYADFSKAAEPGSGWELVVIEGLFALYLDPIRERADLKVFVDLASDERLTRRIKKHMGWGQTYEQVTERYLDTVRFRHDELIEPTRWHADVIVNGTLDRGRGAEVVSAYLRSQLGK